MAEPDTADFSLGRAFRGFEDRLASPRALLVQIGALLTARFKASFRLQNRGGVSWKPRRVPNVNGIIEDLREGREPPSRRLDPRPALVDNAILVNSITFAPVGDNAVEVGTVVPYASVHNFGGESNQTITKTIQDRLVLLLNRDPWDIYAKELGWLIDRQRRPSVLKTKIPARPFVLMTPADHRDVGRLVARVISGEAIQTTTL